MKSLTFKILGKTWVASVYPDKQFVEKFGDKCAGDTDVVHKTIAFSQSDFTSEVVTHEINHAYMEEICLGRAISLTKDQLEEVFSEFMAKWGHDTLRTAKRVYRGLTK